MKIEILFPEFCNLFGDMSNMYYLQKCLPEAQFINTAFEDEPLFVREDVDLIYLGPMTEQVQEKVIVKFSPYKERIKELLEGGAVFLFTGNALEILGTHIENDDCRRIPALGIFPLYAKRDMMNRHNSTFLGSYEEKPIMGFKSQFTMAYTDMKDRALFQVKKGVGLNKKCPFEGIRYNNFFGTYLLGPLLILNPDFTKSLLACMGVSDPTLAFQPEMEAAFQARLKDFREKT